MGLKNSLDKLGYFSYFRYGYLLGLACFLSVFFHVSFCLFLLIVAVLFWVSLADLRLRTITNNSVAFLLCIVIPFAFFTYGEIFFFPAFIALLTGFLLFLAKIVGAGDVKLLSVLMLAVPSGMVMPFLFFVALIGGGLAVFGLLFFRRSISQQGLPYGIAIAGGFILQQVWFSPFFE